MRTIRTTGRTGWYASVAMLSGLLVAGCSSTGSVMTKASLKAQPEPGKALVTFIRPSGLGGGVSFGIWDGGDLVRRRGAGKSGSPHPKIAFYRSTARTYNQPIWSRPQEKSH